MSDDADHVVLTLPRGERGEVRISRSRYQGSTFTKLHLWYPGDDGTLRPGRQVVTIRDGELRDVIGALEKIAAKIGAQPTEQRGNARAPQPQARGASSPASSMSDEEERERGMF